MRAMMTLMRMASILLLAAAVSAQQKTGFKNNPFFKQLIGEWTSEGEDIKMDGQIVKFKEEWKAQMPDERTFIVEGAHEIAEKPVHYRWTFTCSDTGIFAVHQPDMNKESSMRYEVQTDERGSQITLTRVRSNRLKIAVVESFKEGGHDSLKVKETTTDVSGVALHSSTSISRKK